MNQVVVRRSVPSPQVLARCSRCHAPVLSRSASGGLTPAGEVFIGVEADGRDIIKGRCHCRTPYVVSDGLRQAVAAAKEAAGAEAVG